MSLDWQNIVATGMAAFGGGAASYFVAAFFNGIDRKRRRVEDFEREWHSEEVRRSKDAVYLILANIQTISLPELERRLNGQVGHIERVLEVMRRMAVCWREDEVHRHYFLRLLGHDVSNWRTQLCKVDVKRDNYWKPYFEEIRAARFE